MKTALMKWVLMPLAGLAVLVIIAVVLGGSIIGNGGEIIAAVDKLHALYPITTPIRWGILGLLAWKLPQTLRWWGKARQKPLSMEEVRTCRRTFITVVMAIEVVNLVKYMEVG